MTSNAFELVRLYSTGFGTFGVLLNNKIPLCVTLEDPWLDNKKTKSCIPAGEYKVVPHSGMRYKRVWRLEDVPGRDAILIHSGNTIEDTQGCILVGREFGLLEGTPAILGSAYILRTLQNTLPESFNLKIRWSY
jgi:hypothetical protein